jgi:hypothetical protein
MSTPTYLLVIVRETVAGTNSIIAEIRTPNTLTELARITPVIT